MATKNAFFKPMYEGEMILRNGGQHSPRFVHSDNGRSEKLFRPSGGTYLKECTHIYNTEIILLT